MLKKRKLLRFIFIAILLFGFIFWQNNAIVVNRTEYRNEKIPETFDGFVIVHISDLHNKKFGYKQERLLNQIKKEEPDMIVITGDLIDRRRYHPEISLDFVEKAMRLAPVYYVCGNHEILSGKYEEFRMELKKRGVEVLDNEKRILERNGQKILLFGMMDSLAENFDADPVQWLRNQDEEEKAFKILLAHHPELFATYADCRMDLVFSGHAHGGQFRLPGIGGLIAPGQGFFPKYTEGHYRREGTTMFVSRGLGNSLIPVRILNRPEVVSVELLSGGGK